MIRTSIQRLMLRLALRSVPVTAPSAAQAQADTGQAPIDRTVLQPPTPAGFADPSRSLPLSRQLGERREAVPVGMGITTAVIKCKLVCFYAYSVYRHAANLDWVRSVTRAWLPLAAISNAP